MIDDPLLDHLGRVVRQEIFPVGLQIDGRYEIRHRIGRGGMGEIFYAWDTRLNRPVAMKVLARGRLSPEWFEEEAKTTASIDHPGVVPIYDRGVLPDGRLYFTMKYVEGRTLDELDEPRVRMLEHLGEAAAIVEHAHARDVVHRDLKPANIMVDENGRVYVLDWGIARMKKELSPAGRVIGTIEYMSPEQARGDLAAVDKRSDVYSLGAILYRLVTGRAPIVGSKESEMLRAAGEGRFPPLRDVPQDLESVCLKAMDRHPARRYASAGAFSADLRRYLAGEPVVARPPSALDRARRWFSRNRVPVLTAAIVLLACGVGAAGVFEYRRGVRMEQKLQEAERDERDDRLDSARDEYCAALEWDRDNRRAREGFERVASKIRAREAERSQAQEEALRLFELGRSELEKAERRWYEPEPKDIFVLADRARGFFERAIERAPHLALGHYLLGRAWEILGDEARAEECWTRALGIDPGFARARFFLARLLMERAYFASIGSSSGERRVRFSMTERLAAEADSHLRRSLDLDDAILHDLGRALLALVGKDASQTLRICEEGIRRWRETPGVEEFFWILALAAENEESALNRALAIRPNFPRALFARAALYQQERRLAESIRDYTRVLELRPRFAEAYHNRGTARAALGDFAGARADFDEALRLRPGLAEGYFHRGVLRWKSGDPEAVRDLTEAIRLRADFTDAYVRRAEIRRFRGDLAAALEDVEAAAAIQPRDPVLRYNCGVLRQNLGDWEGAILDYSEAVRLNENYFEALHNRGLIYRLLGERSLAIRDLRKTLELAPADWTYRARSEWLLRELRRSLRAPAPRKT